MVDINICKTTYLIVFIILPSLKIIKLSMDQEMERMPVLRFLFQSLQIHYRMILNPFYIGFQGNVPNVTRIRKR